MQKNIRNINRSIIDISEAQLVLSGLNGGPADGFIGGRTKLAVSNYQKLISKTEQTGNIEDIYNHIIVFKEKHVIHSNDIRCKCLKCSGYGFEKYGSNNDERYRPNKPELEAYYQYEYPGISSMIIYSAMIIMELFPQFTWSTNSGYRCWFDNLSHGRLSTNHMGKAIDIQPRSISGESFSRSDLIKICDDIRIKLYDLGIMNIGWNKFNMISLEPSNIAPTWIHIDCRMFDRKRIIESIVRF